jgi:thioredoxin-related protein
MRIFALVFILTLTLSASPDTIKNLGYYTDYTQAVAAAKEEKKPLMLVVVTSYCPWCRKFERKTLASKAVATRVKKSYIAVIVDRNKDSGSFPQRFQTPRIPTVFFIDPTSGKEYWETMGYLNKSDYLDALVEAKKLFLKR